MWVSKSNLTRWLRNEASCETRIFLTKMINCHRFRVHAAEQRVIFLYCFPAKTQDGA